MIRICAKYVGAAMVVLAVGTISSCSGDQEQVENTAAIISVGVSVIERSDETLVSTYTGSVEGEKHAVLYARLSEAVQAIHFKEGSKVQADDIIMEINPEGAGSNYRRALSLFRNSEKNLNKMRYLYKEGAVSESAFDAAETEFDVNKAALDAASRLVNIHTPIAGIVTSIDVSEGELVQIGQKLATVATTDRLRVRFGVNSDEVTHFVVGEPVEISSDLATGTAAGEIAAIASSADPATRTFQVETIVDNAAGLFRPGMFVRVSFVRQQLNQALAIPQKAIITLDGVPTAFTVANGRAEKRTVELGEDLGGRVIVKAGLNAGDTLVVLGQDYLGDGSDVNITAINGRTL